MADVNEAIQGFIDLQQEGFEEFPELKLKIHNAIIREFEKYGYTPHDIEYNDTYFIIYHGINSIMDFKIKEAPEWLFGVWVYVDTEESKVNIDIFAQNELSMYKFKPSESTFSKEIEMDLDENIDVNDIDLAVNIHNNSILPFFKIIMDKPYLAFYIHMNGFPEDGERITRRKAKRSYKKFINYEKFYKERKAKLEIELMKEYRKAARKLGVTQVKGAYLSNVIPIEIVLKLTASQFMSSTPINFNKRAKIIYEKVTNKRKYRKVHSTLGESVAYSVRGVPIKCEHKYVDLLSFKEFKNDDEAWEYLLEFYDVTQEEIDEFFKYRIVKDYYDGLNLISNLKRPDDNNEGSE